MKEEQIEQPIIAEDHDSMQNRFRNELEILLNQYSQENGSDTPDFILADYLLSCLQVFDNAVKCNTTYNFTRQGKAMFGKDISKTGGVWQG